MNRLAFHYSLPVLLLALSGNAEALGLGELRGQPNLGEPLRLEVDVLGDGKASLDPACFRLIQPQEASDLPWLKKASFSIRKGTPPVLLIRSEAPLREPILQLTVQVACGHEVTREYLLLSSPPSSVAGRSLPEGGSSRQRADELVSAPSPRAAKARPAPVELLEAPTRLLPRRSEKRLAPSGLPDRLLLSSGEDSAEPSLRLATDLLSLRAGARELAEARREILRLEFRMLLAMHEQATTQLETAEKLRNMEATLGELQQRATEFSQRVEQDALPVAATPVTANAAPLAVIENPEQKLPAPTPVAPVSAAPAAVSEWSLYGVALGGLLGLAGWLGWRNYQERRQRTAEIEFPLRPPELQVDPRRDDEHEELGGVDLAVEPAAMGMPMQVDFELDVAHDEPAHTPPPVQSATGDSVLSISATTLDEHFEANPVMELADIMLSFGRVKGAAQALQEYIDNNPQEALQPWIRLMDVYRMAGMRAEFETVARNLNQNFNVEVQHWESVSPVGSSRSIDLVLDEMVPAVGASSAEAKPESIEDMPRLMHAITELWGTGDVVGYLYQLLRDNRGGKRVGFALAVVEEILFLVELKETSNRMEKESANS
ncbi:FimV family protein [Dechloromonas denitrificans]|uniref:type IV pilus assembly protein FimV n=1 Tax=Dechloromonas denitrificans TaxID=281362 RepID=UPI0012FC9F6A|nr:hypothetical protein [Dechloromonas denitrificans]